MTGTAKQVAYATDIINKTISRIDAVIAKDTAKVDAIENRIRAARPEYTAKLERQIIAAWEEYRAMVASISSMPDYPAAEVISFEQEASWFKYGNDFVAGKCGHSAF